MTSSVLIVDDSLTVRMDLYEAFEAGGFHALACGTVTEARVSLAAEQVDAIVLDVILPDADGVDFLQELRASPRFERTPVLMLSTEAEVRDRVRALRRGADEYIGKPYDSSYVVARARKLVGSPQPPANRILVIDDSVTFRSELRRALEREGYEVSTASTGEEGLRAAGDQRPAAIVVDGMLPGADGATVIRRVRLDAALRDVPCLLLTASDDQSVELQALEAGADAFVRKSTDTTLVLAKLAAILRQTATAAAPDHPASVHSPKRVLAVDDSPTYLDQVAATLRDEGYDVALARSGEESLELLATQSVDCILLDLSMPGLGGRETCRRIKAAPTIRDIPLLMVTSVDDAGAMLAGLSDGADDYIHKADGLDVLKARVRAQIRRKQFQDENRRVRDQLLRRELVASEARAAQRLAETRAALVEELEWKNRELEAFGYSVSHDLRNPVQIVHGLSQLLLEEYADVLGGAGCEQLRRINAAAARMADLIDAMMRLSQVSRSEIVRETVDLTGMARGIVDELRRRDPDRVVEVVIQDGLTAQADRDLICVLLENTLGNAWKYTQRTPAARIEVGSYRDDKGIVYFVRDNGAGFSMDQAGSLFRPYERLHSANEFPGTGIGLATAHRVVDRHGGRIWAEGAVGAGSTFHFTTG
jgi:DNA-binding response OmpR family regulator